jgi:hypothetical protein
LTYRPVGLDGKATMSRLRVVVSLLAVVVVLVGLVQIDRSRSSGLAIEAPTAPSPQPTRPGSVSASPDPGGPGENAEQNLTGVLEGAAYEIRVPAEWNGTLVLYAHGLRNTSEARGAPREVSAFLSDKAEDLMLAKGYAVAGSAYRQDGWAVAEGIDDMRTLLEYFKAKFGAPQTTLMAGFSMGSVIALSEIERSDLYDGVLAGCPIGAGAARTFDAMLALALAYDAVYGWPASWGTPGDIRDNLDFETDVQATLTRQFQAPDGPARFELIRLLAGIPQGAEWWKRVWGFATETRADLERRAGGPVAQNLDHRYAVSPKDRDHLHKLGITDAMVDETIAKMSAHRIAPGNGRAYAERYADYSGLINRPVLMLGSRTDALIPPASSEAYTATVETAGTTRWLANAWTAGRGHCQFNAAQIAIAVDALNSWVQVGTRPQRFPASHGFITMKPPIWFQP